MAWNVHRLDYLRIPAFKVWKSCSEDGQRRRGRLRLKENRGVFANLRGFFGSSFQIAAVA